MMNPGASRVIPSALSHLGAAGLGAPDLARPRQQLSVLLVRQTFQGLTGAAPDDAGHFKVLPGHLHEAATV
jgi:hypothetical protein